MNNLPWGAENDTSAPYNEETKNYNIEVEIVATVCVDLPKDADDDLFTSNLSEIIESHLINALKEFDIEHIQIRVY